MNKYVFDLESNGFLYDVDTIHCIVVKDIVSNSTYKFYGDKISDGISKLMEAKLLIGHNIAQYDIPVIEKLSGINLFNYCTIRDTYCMSKLFYPERLVHSLESYGEQFGRNKPVHEDWTQFSEEMLHRCTQDVEINHSTYNWLVESNCRDWDWINALELEQEFAYYQGLQELEGVSIDLDMCYHIVNSIDTEVNEIDAKIKPILPKRIKAIGNPIMKPYKKDGTYTKQVEDWLLKEDFVS